MSVAGRVARAMRTGRTPKEGRLIMLGIWILVSVVTGLLAARKGYNFALWALASGILGLIILAFLPFANRPGQERDEERRLKATGNTIAGVLAAVGVLLVVIQLLPA